MNILILSFYFPPDLAAGSFRAGALLEALSGQLAPSDSLEIITTFPNRYASYNIKEFADTVIDGVTITRIKIPSHHSGMLDQAKAFIAFYRQTMKLTQNKEYDVVYATSSRLFTAFLGARVAKSKKLPLFLDIRDIFVDTLSDVLNKKIIFFAKPVLNWIENYTFGSAKHINLVSKGFRDYFQRKFPHASYSYYTNGIDDEFLDYQKSDTPKFTELKTIVYAGNIGAGQGLHKILPALASATKGMFKIVVYGDGGLRHLLLQEIEKLQLTNIEIHNPIERKQLLDIYESADILFLHLNDYDAFKKVLPSKIFEYAAMGKPILAGVSGYAAEFIRAEVRNAEIFSPCDLDEAIKALGKLSINDIDRDLFIMKYARKNIMKMLSEEIISVSTSYRP